MDTYMDDNMESSYVVWTTNLLEKLETDQVF